MQPNRALLLYSDSNVRYLVPRSIRENPRFDIYGEFSWSFILEQEDDRNTRLISRTLTMPLILVEGEFFAARKMLYGIKRRVEQTTSWTIA